MGWLLDGHMMITEWSQGYCGMAAGWSHDDHRMVTRLLWDGCWMFTEPDQCKMVVG